MRRNDRIFDRLLRTDRRLLQMTAVACFLVAAIWAVFWQVAGHRFIEYDDQVYLLENPHVRTGLSLTNVRWAFTSTYAANWHPLTWLSHMLDVELFGLHPAGPHLVNVAFHTANAVLLFFLLCRLTGALWRSAAVAALFALHPLHVESVAWAAERKDVLSTLFWMLTIYLYARYVERQTPGRYILTLAAFAAGLMAKPMLVTLPFVLLLLDYWPLARPGAGEGCTGAKRRSFRFLALEKLPFLLLAGASSWVTLVAQEKGHAVTSLANTPLSARIGNALLAYVCYLEKTFWPRGLAVIYPFPDAIGFWPPFAAASFLSVITIVTIHQRRHRPYLLVGWLWYVGTLVPVIGIVRVGLQSMADRYTYVPLIGVFLMLVWAIADFSGRRPYRRTILVTLCCVIFSACSLATWRQLSYWRDTETLASHALDVTRNNFVAHALLGRQLEREGKLGEALRHFDVAVRIAPWYEYAKIHQGLILKNQGRLNAAIFKYNEVILQNPTSVAGHINLGILMGLENRLPEAMENFRIALDFDPDSATAHYNMGLTLSRLGRLTEAIAQYRTALSIDPYDADCHNNLGIDLAQQGNYDEAARHFSAALRLRPDFFGARSNLALARAKMRSAAASGH